MKALIALAVVAALPAVASAQALLVGGERAPILRAGTEVPLRMLTELNTKGKTLRAGHRFEMETAEAISLNGQVVIPSGTHAVGEVTSVRNKGMWGKSGNIEARVLYLRAGDRQIRLSGTINDKGKTGTGGVVAAVAFLPVAGFFTTGTSAVLPVGTPVKGFLDEDVPVAFAAATAAKPLEVPEAVAVPVPGTEASTRVAAAPL